MEAEFEEECRARKSHTSLFLPLQLVNWKEPASQLR